jgi:hypothetical protein
LVKWISGMFAVVAIFKMLTPFPESLDCCHWSMTPRSVWTVQTGREHPANKNAPAASFGNGGVVKGDRGD